MDDEGGLVAQGGNKVILAGKRGPGAEAPSVPHFNEMASAGINTVGLFESPNRPTLITGNIRCVRIYHIGIPVPARGIDTIAFWFGK